MSRFFAAGFIVVSTLVLLWNVFLAGQIARVRTASRPFTGLTAICGLLLAPAVLVVLATASILYARAIYVIAWVWPLTLVLFAVQATYATSRRLVTPFIGIPIVAYDVLLAVIAVSKYIVYLGGTPPQAALALIAAQTTSLGLVFGRAALFSPFVVQLPILGPAFPARWAASATVRAAIAALAAVSTALIAGQYPNGVQVVRSYLKYEDARMQERPDGNFALGIELFPVLSGGPPPLALRSDLALVDSIRAEAIGIVVDPGVMRAGALDSIARSLESVRADSILLIVTIGYSPDSRRRLAENESRFIEARLRAVEEITRRLRPDYLLPARDPYGEGVRALGVRPVEFWIRYLTRAAEVIQRTRPRTIAALSVSPLTALDSALYAWAASPSSPMAAVGFTLFPSFSGGRALELRMNTAARWMDQAAAPRKEHWVFAGGGFPMSHGEPNHVRALRAQLAWATARSEMRGLIVSKAGDYDVLTGLRAPGGRLRRAVPELTRAARALREIAGS